MKQVKNYRITRCRCKKCISQERKPEQKWHIACCHLKHLKRLILAFLFLVSATGMTAFGASCEGFTLRNGMLDWKKVDLKKLFTAMKEEKIPLNLPGMRKNEAKLRTVTGRVLGHPVGSLAVYRGVTKNIGDWYESVKKLEFDPSEGVTRNFGFWTDKKIIELIKALSPEFPLLTFAAFRADEEKFERITVATFGRKLSVAAFWKQIYEFYTDYETALRLSEVQNAAATINDLKFELTGPRILRILEDLKDYFTIFTEEYLLLESAHFRQVMRYLYGKEISAKDFIEKAKLHFGSWENAFAGAKITQ